MLRRHELPALILGLRIMKNISFLLILSSIVGLSYCDASTGKFNPLGLGDLTEESQILNLQLNALNAQAAPPVPLSTRGRYIVDADGNRFKLKSVNWFGANEAIHVQEGLNQQPIENIVALIQAWGLNSVRLPFSNEMLRNTNPVDPAHVAANPQFIGMTPLEVFDQTIESLTNAGLVVILNNHTTYSESCCGYDRNGLWYHVNAAGQLNLTTTMWRNDWVMLANRYKNNKMVVGADLRNEVRTMRTGDTIVPVNPNWGSGDGNDWRRASKEAGIAILEANPDLLIVVEGINWTGSLPAFGAYRPGLIPIKVDSVPLQESNKLVYGYHTYPFTGPRHNGDRSGGTSSGYNTYSDIAFNSANPAAFDGVMEEEWAYVLEEGNHYTAPVWISEFGAHWQPTIDLPEFAHYPVWMSRFVDKLIEKDVGYAWWALNPGALGLATENYDSNLPATDWRYNDLTRLFNDDGLTGPVAETPKYTQVQGDVTDDRLSNHLRSTDWRPSHNKVTCRDGDRLVGVSTGYRGLCTNDQLGDLWDANRNYTVAVDSSNGSSVPFARGRDWANGFFKYECPVGYYASGFSKRNSSGGFTGLVCAKANQPLGDQCSTVWMFGSTTRMSQQGGDWAPGRDKAQCADDQYLAGVARRNSGSSPTVGLCCGVQEKPMALKGRWLTNRCMDIVGGVMANGTKIEIRDCTGADNQQWFYNRVTGQFRSKKDPNYCLDNTGAYNSNGAEVHMWQCIAGGHPNQAFDFDEHLIRNRANRGYAVGASGSGNNGTRVNIWRTVPANTQRWAEDYNF